ncbi:MAG: trypsin-like peptidase domain-containing protein [Aigarchaeota archaeon]|nr:trypsin-like peptidase domain-containing protein [Candidatus Pelearchaeum maunauluense]
MSRLSILAVLTVFSLLAIMGFQLYSISLNIQQLQSNVKQLALTIENLKESINGANQAETIVSTVIVEATQADIASVYERVKDSVVMVRVLTPFGESSGSGFVYDTLGHIVTNNHVVEDGSVFRVSFLDGAVLEAELVGRDPYSDLAVLKVDASKISLKPLKLGNSSELKIGERIIVVGNPFGLEGTLTTGVVSQKDRLLPTKRGFSIPGVIQIDAAVNPGNSGGPLLNMRGEVVGVTTAIESPIRGFVGIGYAIPSTIVARVVPTLIEKGTYEHSWLGIAGRNMNQLIAEALGVSVKRGFLVESVVAGGPAAKAGIRGGEKEIIVDGIRILAGGDIIIAINGLPIKSIDDILTYLEEKTSPNDVVTLTISRDDKILNVDVVLGVRPPP